MEHAWLYTDVRYLPFQLSHCCPDREVWGDFSVNCQTWLWYTDLTFIAKEIPSNVCSTFVLRLNKRVDIISPKTWSRAINQTPEKTPESLSTNKVIKITGQPNKATIVTQKPNKATMATRKPNKATIVTRKPNRSTENTQKHNKAWKSLPTPEWAQESRPTEVGSDKIHTTVQ